jgi:VanZ family protein
MISRQQSRVLFWLALAAVVLLSLVPLTRATPFGYQDKMQHGLAYAALYFLSARAYVPRYPLWLLGVAFVLFGIAIEFAQSLTGHRQTDILDMLANTSGVVLVGALLSLPMMRAYLSADVSYHKRLKTLDDKSLRASYDDTLKAPYDEPLMALDDERRAASTTTDSNEGG